MNDNQFNKGIEDLREIKMTNAERSSILNSILSKPIESPYAKYSKILVYISSRGFIATLVFVLTVSLSFSGVVFASGSALPGDILYPVKTKVVEPVLDIVYSSPEKRIAWSEEKVERRIEEAKILAEDNKLDEEKAVELEKKIENSSREFAKAVRVVVETEPEAEKKLEREAEYKNNFKEKINKKEEVPDVFEVKFERINEEPKSSSSTSGEVKVQLKSVEKSKSEGNSNKNSDKSSDRSERVNKLKQKAIETIERVEKKEDKKTEGDGRKDSKNVINSRDNKSSKDSKRND